MKKEQFIDSLPLRFSTQDYISYASKLDITQKTAERYITNLCKTNFLLRESQGNYYNPSKEESEENKETLGMVLNKTLSGAVPTHSPSTILCAHTIVGLKMNEHVENVEQIEKK